METEKLTDETITITGARPSIHLLDTIKVYNVGKFIVINVENKDDFTTVMTVKKKSNNKIARLFFILKFKLLFFLRHGCWHK